MLYSAFNAVLPEASKKGECGIENMAQKTQRSAGAHMCEKEQYAPWDLSPAQ